MHRKIYEFEKNSKLLVIWNGRSISMCLAQRAFYTIMIRTIRIYIQINEKEKSQSPNNLSGRSRKGY